MTIQSIASPENSIPKEQRWTDGCEFTVDAQAIYVSTPATGGTDGSGCGTWDYPCASINYGISEVIRSTNPQPCSCSC